MRLEVLSSVNELTETYTELFTTIPNDKNAPSLTSSSQLSSIPNTLNKVEENNNLSTKDDLINLVLQLQIDIKNFKVLSTKYHKM